MSQFLAQEGQLETQARRIVLTPASKIPPRPTTWVWDTTPQGAKSDEKQGRFPAGSLVIAAGRAGLGKSQFAVWMSAQITQGTLQGGLYGTPRNVIYAAAEDSWEMTIVPRLIAAGADLDRVFHISVADDGDLHARLTLPVDTFRLEAAIGEYDVALIVCDPLLSMIDHAINDYRAKEVRQALEPIVGMADRTRSLLLGLAHFTKAQGNDPLTLISGSGAFGQLIRAGVGFACEDEAGDRSFILSQIKNNLGRENLPSLKYVIEPVPVETPEGISDVSRFNFTGEESERSVRDLLGGPGAEDTYKQGDQGEALNWLKHYLSDLGGEALADEAIRAGKKVGFAYHTLHRARKGGKIASRKSAFGKGWVWALPAEDDTKMTKKTVQINESPSSSS